MDSLRARFADRRRLIPLLVAAAAAVLVVAVLVAAGQASGSTAERPAVRVLASTPSPTPVLVHVGGEVRHPGLVALPTGARVVDAVTAAGGPTGAADQGALNLAAKVADGAQVVVPKRGAKPTVSAAPGGATGAGGTPVSLGSATLEQLETLPRIGPALAARILAYRDAHGGFSSVDELGEVGGIGPKTLEGLRPLVAP